MPLSSSEIVIGATGNVRVAPVGTVAPTDIATAWAAAWVDLGYTSEDGITFNNERTTEDIMAWQALDPVRVVGTMRMSTVSFSLMQWNEVTVPLAFGGGTVVTTVGPPAHYLYTPPAGATPDERALGIEWVDGTKIYRLIMPKVVLTESVETNLIKAAAGMLPLTFKALGVDGVASFYIRTNDPTFAV